ncbi:MAG TPA: ATP-binding protein, partial [Flavobacterium sp.]
GTCQDITKEFFLNRELVQLNESLSRKNNELLNINRELESFNYIASHDLQEPLRKIQIYSGRLMEQASEISEDAKQSIHKVIHSASRMQRLIADLIEFSQISTKSDAKEAVSLNILIDEVKNNFSHLIEQENASFNVQQLPHIKVIPFQFSQLLSNIIGNALKYKRDGVSPEITITSKTEMVPDEERSNLTSAYWVLSICDNGIGFDENQKEKIFDLFKRLHSSEKYSGTGIGLAICKKIVNNHNGFIRADSQKGEGSCFHIYLPEELLVKQ